MDNLIIFACTALIVQLAIMRADFENHSQCVREHESLQRVYGPMDLLMKPEWSQGWEDGGVCGTFHPSIAPVCKEKIKY